MDLQELIARVEEDALDDAALARVAAARDLSHALSALGDQVVDHFVEAARREGCSWAQIGSVLGVSRQGAQQRFGFVRRRSRPARGGQIAFPSRFGRDARRAVVEAQTAARAMGHEHVDTEHLLLGIFAAGADAAGADVLARCDLGRRDVEDDVVAMVGRGSEPTAGHIPFSPHAKRVLELSLREALALGDRRIGSEHLVLALLRERKGAAAQILESRGVDRERVLEVVRESREPASGD